MKDFFRSTKSKIFIVIGMVLIGLMIRTAANGGFSSFTADALSFIVTPFQKASSSVSGFFSGAVSNIVDFSTLRAENDQLKKKISEMQTKIVNYNEMQQKYQQLEEAYGLHEENPDFKMKPATVISHDPGQFYSSFTIDKGQIDGISYQDVVINSDGDLLGKVTMVYTNSAVVTTILDPSVPVGVMISETGDAGQSQGDLELLNKEQFKVGYLPKNSAVSPGNIVITSGQGGVYPKNLKVGTVTEIGTEDTGMNLYAVCQPIASPSEAKKVFVITSFNGKNVGNTSQGGGK